MHPSSFYLDALALGGVDAETAPTTAQDHLAECAECIRYVDGLRAALADAAPLEPLRVPEPAPARVFALRRTLYAAAPVLAIAAGALLFFRVPTPTESPTTPPVSPVTEAHFKGNLPMAVVLERDGVQSRHTDRVAVRAGDRLRIEVALDVARPTTAGILEDTGEFATALAPTLLEPGTHYSDLAIRIDDHPRPGWILAGVPDAVERARNHNDFADVAAIPMTVQSP